MTKASQKAVENQASGASQPASETHQPGASQRTDEAPVVVASHPAHESQRDVASQNADETQSLCATYGKLRVLVETYYACQQHRIKAGNRIWALQDRLGLEEDDMRPLHDFVDDRMMEMERRLKAMVAKELKGEPLWEDWLKGVKGIGPCLAGGFIAWVGDPGRFETPSALWKYCGLNVVDGKAPHRAVGEKGTWNPALRTLCWKAGESFVKCGDGYRALYDQFKAAYQQSHGNGNGARMHKHPGLAEPHAVGLAHDGDPHRYEMSGKGSTSDKARTALEWHGFDLSPGHIHAMAKRKVVKVFVVHLWQRWRQMRGLPTREAYVVEKLGHNGVIQPVEQ